MANKKGLQWIPKKETRLHMEAFNYYYSLGKERSLAAVYDKFGKSSVWGSKISRAFNWKQRAEERDRASLEKSLDNFDERLMIANRQNLQLIQAFRARFAEKLRDNKIPIYASDLDTFAKLERLILGEATERVEDTTMVSLAKRFLELKKKNANQIEHVE